MPAISKDEPDEVDILVGKRLRARRLEVSKSQEKLADGLGVTFQQVQKYERGTNRISASMLARAGKTLGCPVAYFFQDVDGETGKALEENALHAEFFAHTYGAKIARAFIRLGAGEQLVVATMIDGLAKVEPRA